MTASAAYSARLAPGRSLPALRVVPPYLSTALSAADQSVRLALFSDSLENTDGVASSCRRFLARSLRRGSTVRVPYCGTLPMYAAEHAPEVFARLPCAASYPAPFYASMRFYRPSLRATVDWLLRERITHVELATPGPMGVVGMLAAKLLGLHVTASYHTEVPALLRQLSDSPLLGLASRKYVAWFYGAADRVFVFSAASREKLIQLGVPPALLSLMPVTIEPSEFSPAFASERVFARLGVATGGRPVVLSVGRLSPEKNLPLIVDAVERLQDGPRAPVLVIVGDGPERARLEQMHKPFVHLVGVQHGRSLRELYASADAFVFASCIDTLGLVAMEAMSSGAPVLVPRETGISELIEDGVSGLCYALEAPALASSLRALLACPERRARLARNGRRVMVRRWQGASFDQMWHAMVGAR